MEKALPPTKRKIEKAKKEGNVAKSPILTSSCILLWCCLLFFALTRFPWLSLKFLLPLGEPDLEVTNTFFLSVIVVIITVVLGGAAVLGCSSELLQSGGVWRTSFNFSRINAFGVVDHLKQAPFRFFSTFCYSLIFLVSAFLLVLSVLPTIIFNTNNQYLMQQLANAAMSCFFIFAVIAALDWSLQKNRHLSKLKMSFDEMKRELREEEGDFYIRAQRRALHEQMIYQEIVKRVRECRFIVVEKQC